MKKLVLKFGGTSVGTIENIKKVANIIKKKFSEGNEIIVVVSAMSGVTDELKAKSARTAMLFSRTNTLLSLPMLLCMVGAQHLLSI